MARETNREPAFLALVAAGVYRIDADGSIWKLWDSYRKRPICRRADHVWGGRYRMVKHEEGRRYFLVQAHRVVYVHFNGPIPSGHVIKHKNGVKDDNRPENLESVTQTENNRHAVRTRLNVSPRGDRRWNTKISDATVIAMREDYASGTCTQAELAERYGVDFRTLSDVLRGKRRSHLPGPIVVGPVLRRQESVRDPVTGRFLADPTAPGSKLRSSSLYTIETLSHVEDAR